MSAWHDDLKQFQEAILGQEIVPHAVCTNYPIEIALDVYRNNYRGNLRGALSLAYPVIEKIVGEEFFGMMAKIYIENHPSSSGNLHEYGAGFSNFLAGFPPARSLDYLPDMAKLEWACHQAYFAEDVESLDIAMLVDIPLDEQPHIRFSINPICTAVKSTYPIADIWNAHQSDQDFFVDLDAGAQHALVVRKNGDVSVHILSEEEYEWFEHIHNGAPLWAATAATMESSPEFDLQAALFKMVKLEVLVGFDFENEGENK